MRLFAKKICFLVDAKANPLSSSLPQSARYLWQWLNTVFNRVDESRIKEVGPDRACAEWLLRCGAHVKWKNANKWHTDYNSLPLSGFRSFKIEEINADEAAVMHIGFPHLKGLTELKKIRFHKCAYLDDSSLAQLSLVTATLRELEISSCGNITAHGLRQLQVLSNLEHMLLYDFPEISNRDACLKELQDLLPSCSIDFPYAREDN